MPVIGVFALIRVVARLRRRQLARMVIAARNPGVSVPMAITGGLIGVLAAVGLPVGGLVWLEMTGGTRIYSSGPAAPDSAALLAALAVAGIALLLPTRGDQYRGLERLAAYQPVPPSRVELIRRLDDAVLAFLALAVLACPFLFGVFTGAHPGPGTGARALLAVAVAAVILSVLASVTSSLLRRSRALASRPRLLNRAGQVLLACYLAVLAYPAARLELPGLPPASHVLGPALSPLGWAWFVPVAGQVTDAGLSWVNHGPVRAALDWAAALAVLAALWRLHPLTSAPAPGQAGTAPGGGIRHGRRGVLERCVPRHLEPRRRAALLLQLRLTRRDQRVSAFARWVLPLTLITAISLWQVTRTTTAGAGTLTRLGPAAAPAVVVSLVVTCALLVLADTLRRTGSARWIIQTAPIPARCLSDAAATHATVTVLPVLIVAGAVFAALAPGQWPTAVFVLLWAPVMAYGAAWATAAAQNRPVMRWVARAGSVMTATAATTAITELSTLAPPAGRGWLLPCAAAATLTAALWVTAPAWRAAPANQPRAGSDLESPP